MAPSKQNPEHKGPKVPRYNSDAEEEGDDNPKGPNEYNNEDINNEEEGTQEEGENE